MFFCDLHAPWQRGSNENMNGLLRDYFPKGTDLSQHLDQLAPIAVEVDERPREARGWRGPADLLTVAIATA